MVFIKTPFNGFSVKFSPYNPNRIAVATAQNFGIIGNGRQEVFDITPNGLVPIASFDTGESQDAARPALHPRSAAPPC